jgi:hypothetical protein
MSAFLVLAALALAAPAAAADPPNPNKEAEAKCQRTSMHVADEIGAYRGKSLTPQKLNQLPPAVTYMAVYRQIGGCEAPLTLSDYRQPRRR